jgi:anthranilate synthase/indole-3-glycerol phosphate synthase/phosphoribosylanthranilate isomerase
MGKVPVLGVCMGLECIVDLLGGDVSGQGALCALAIVPRLPC